MTGCSFTSSAAREWSGRYGRIPGDTTVFHVEHDGGEWLPIVYWKRSDETGRCAMVRSDASVALAQAVNAAKGFLRGSPGGTFLINEFGQVIVPSSDGTRRAFAGVWSGPMSFRDPFSNRTFDLYDDARMSSGALWDRPYVGNAYNLSARDELYYWRETPSSASKEIPPFQDTTLIHSLRALRPRKGIRFIVGCGGVVLTKQPLGHQGGDDAEWQPKYVGRLEWSRWFAMEVG